MRPLLIGIVSFCVCLAPNTWHLTPGVSHPLLFAQSDQRVTDSR